MKRDYEADWLEHCIFCDGRHTPKQTCEQFKAARAEEQSSRAAILLPAKPECGSEGNAVQGATQRKHNAA